MRYLLFILSLSAYAQTTGAICWLPDKTNQAKAVCMDIPPSVKKAAADYMASQTVGTPPTPKYAGAADFLFATVRAVLDEVIRRFPPPAIVADQTTAADATASAAAKQTALLPRVPVEDPQ